MTHERLPYFHDDAISLVKHAQKELRLTEDAVGSVYDFARVIAEVQQLAEIDGHCVLLAINFVRLGGLGGVLDDCPMCRLWREISARFEAQLAHERTCTCTLPF